MKNRVINLINIKIIDTKVELESIYKEYKDAKTSVYVESSNDIEKTYEKIDFSNEYYIIKINVKINNIKEDTIKFKIKDDNSIYDGIILDNKDTDIFDKNNNYIVFLDKYKIQILKDEIKISKKNIFDKYIYEINKQLYSIKKYKKINLFRLIGRKKRYYLFNDRIMYGDDNAEQLFKYINKVDRRMGKRCYFVIDKKSPKLKEISRYGKVLKFGSIKHKIKYLKSRMIISSHASYFDRVYNPFNEEEMKMLKDLITKKFVFLQHGVIFNDLHTMLNRPQIIADLFITTTNAEFNEITNPKYMYEENMVVCTGLARFDRLENLKENVILIAPTWRTYLTDAEYGDKRKQSFEQSEFYMEYKNILEDEELLKELDKYKFKIKFLLHPAFIKFKQEFEKYNNENIEVLTTDEIIYSELFKECSIFITDYSSTHFDLAYLKKPIIYYQFDREKFHNSHYNKGYFEYEKDGFGDVIYNKDDLINEIVEYIKNDCNTKNKYEERVNTTFKYLDKNNSQRIYKQINQLDRKQEKDYRFNNVH